MGKNKFCDKFLSFQRLRKCLKFIAISQLINSQRILTGSFLKNASMPSTAIWTRALNPQYLEGCTSKKLWGVPPYNPEISSKVEWSVGGTSDKQAPVSMCLWVRCKLVQSLLKTNWNYAPKVTKLCIPFDPTIPQCAYPKEIKEKGKCPYAQKSLQLYFSQWQRIRS